MKPAGLIKLGAAFLAVNLLCVMLFARIPDARSYVPLRVAANADAFAWSAADAPAWFQADDPDVTQADYFREALGPSLEGVEGELATGIAVMDWVRAQVPTYEALRPIPGDPISVHQAMQQGVPAQCGNFATLFHAAATSVGLQDVRLWYFFAENGWNYNGHVANEIWVSDLNKWVMLDPMNNTYVLVDGIPGSVVEIREAARRGEFHRLETVTGVDPHYDPGTLLTWYADAMAVVSLDAAHQPLAGSYANTWQDDFVSTLPPIGPLRFAADRAFALMSGEALQVVLLDDLSGSAQLPIPQVKLLFTTIVISAVLLLLITGRLLTIIVQGQPLREFLGHVLRDAPLERNPTLEQPEQRHGR